MCDQASEPPDGRSQRDRMLAGDLYIADDPQLAADNLRALTLTRQFNASDPADAQARLVLLRELLGSLGEAPRSVRPCTATTATRPTSGPGPSSTSGGPAGRGRHQDRRRRPGRPQRAVPDPDPPGGGQATPGQWEAAQPISVGDNVWLGGGVIICPGVSIGENTVVGAGAVVVRDLSANVIAVGNPAEVIRSL